MRSKQQIKKRLKQNIVTKKMFISTITIHDNSGTQERILEENY